MPVRSRIRNQRPAELGLPSRPRILFSHVSLDRGGAEVLRISVLQELVKRGMPVEVVTLKQPGELAPKVTALGIRLHVLGNRGGLLDGVGIARLARLISRIRPDIVQSSQFLANLHTQLACRWTGHTRHVIEEHGIYTWKKARHLWLDRHVNANADAVVACSHQVARSAATQLRRPLERINVIHNCVGSEHLPPLSHGESESPGRTALRKKLFAAEDMDTGNPRLHLTGIVGTLRWEKGHRDLLEAWEQLQRAGVLGKHHHLIVAGDGPLRAELESRAESLDRVHLVGAQTDVRSLLSTLDLFVLPSINEGFGIAIIEAMAAGVPVISTSSGGVPEVLPENCGIKVAPGCPEELANAIRDIVQQRVDIDGMVRRAALRVAKRFTPTVYADQLEMLYHQMIGTTGVVGHPS